MPWIECVPNFSDGRDARVLAALEASIAGAGGRLLDASSDADHHRSVITFAATPERVVDAALAAIGVATERIDLRSHDGVHPRMGATDVCPFVPLEGTSMDDCVALARALAKRVADELGIPTFLYEHAALRPRRRALPDVRRAGVRFLRGGAGGDPEALPDFGPPAPHPTAGSCAIGARDFLVAFNVRLRTSDLGIARRIARRVRESGGGLPGIRALGFPLKSTGDVQVSMNVCDHRRTGLVRAFEEVERLAREAGVAVLGSELIGLAPRAALDEAIAARVRLAHFDPERSIVERRLTP